VLVLCHDASRTEVKGVPGLPIRSLRELVPLYEGAAAWSRARAASVHVACVALNTSALDDQAAARAIRDAATDTGLPAADPVREGAAGADRLAAAVLR
jgi:D-glutamate N-acetyltransferase